LFCSTHSIPSSLSLSLQHQQQSKLLVHDKLLVLIEQASQPYLLYPSLGVEEHILRHEVDGTGLHDLDDLFLLRELNGVGSLDLDGVLLLRPQWRRARSRGSFTRWWQRCTHGGQGHNLQFYLLLI
jgi:hypothetical protein